MSYILDALRKADAQRERDPARGIHAHSIPTGGSSANGRLGGRPLWIGGGAAVLVLLLAAGWFLSRGEPSPRVQTVAAGPTAHTPAAPAAPRMPPGAVAERAPASPPEPSPAPAVELPPDQPAMRGLLRTQMAQADSGPGARTARGAAGGTNGAPPAPAAPVAPPAPAAPPPAASVAPTPPAPATPQPPAAPAPQAAPAPAVAPAAATTAPPAAPAQATTGLPVDAPKIAISGGVYSASPAQRMLIINGQVFNEGSEVAPGVTVEEIKTRTAVLKFKGTRYTVAY